VAQPGLKKIAVACQGGGMHAAFAAGVLNEILEAYRKKKFELAGLSGTSAGALCALMVWYGLAPKKNAPHALDDTIDDAIAKLDQLWKDFVACNSAENFLNSFTFGALRAEEMEIPLLGLSPRALGLNPYAAAYNAFAAFLPGIGVRKQYFDLDELLAQACPALKNDSIEWRKVKTRLLIGASEVVHGFETVFDSDVNKKTQHENKGMQKGEKHKSRYWRQHLPLSLEGVAASGTLPFLRDAERIGKGYYWDGLYSQNPPVREFLFGPDQKNIPDELWIVRINPQQWPYVPNSNKDIQDRQNELMGNLSLNKELDFILKVNDWKQKYAKEKFGKDHKIVTVRSIVMDKKIADNLSYSSKFDRSQAFMDEMRREGRKVGRTWLDGWEKNKAKEYPEDAAYGDHG
jgi:NTE family protein